MCGGHIRSFAVHHVLDTVLTITKVHLGKSRKSRVLVSNMCEKTVNLGAAPDALTMTVTVIHKLGTFVILSALNVTLVLDHCVNILLCTA